MSTFSSYCFQKRTLCNSLIAYVAVKSLYHDILRTSYAIPVISLKNSAMSQIAIPYTKKRIILFYVIPYHILSSYHLPCHILQSLTIPYLVMPCHAILYHISYHIISYHIRPYTFKMPNKAYKQKLYDICCSKMTISYLIDSLLENLLKL